MSSNLPSTSIPSPLPIAEILKPIENIPPLPSSLPLGESLNLVIPPSPTVSVTEGLKSIPSSPSPLYPPPPPPTPVQLDEIHFIKLLPSYEKVPFPFKTPLPAQLSIMTRALIAMSNGKNAVLESPTGTGKTLALLSAALAFQHKVRQDCIMARNERSQRLLKIHEIVIANENLASETKMKAVSEDVKNLWKRQAKTVYPIVGEKELAVKDYPASWWSDEALTLGPRVFYASRTHSQLKQVAKELKRCYFYVRPGGGVKERIDRRIVIPAEQRIVPPTAVSIVLSYEEDEEDKEEVKVGDYGVPNVEMPTLASLPLPTFYSYAPSVAAPNPLSTTSVAIPILSSTTPSVSLPATLISIVPNAILPTIIEPRLVMSILGSRTQTCTNPSLNPKAAGYLKRRAVRDNFGNTYGVDEGCSIMMRNKSARDRRERGEDVDMEEDARVVDEERESQMICKQHDGTDRLSVRLTELRVFDIEDSVKTALNHGGCAYFGNRSLLPESTMILLPYNYLVDAGVREALSIDVKDAVIIIDEAHNISDACTESASIELRRTNLQRLSAEFLDLGRQSKLRTNQDFTKLGRFASEILKLFDELQQVTYGKSDGIINNPRITRDNIGGEISGAGSGSVSQRENSSRVWEGKDSCLFFSTYCGIDAEEISSLGSSYTSIMEYLSELSPFSLYRPKQENIVLCGSMLNMFRHLFRHTDAYVMCLTYKDKIATLCLWCMSPAPAFLNFAANAHSTILTSGTLAPITGFCSELETPFPITLEAPCAVNAKQQLIAHSIQKSWAPSQLVLITHPKLLAEISSWPYSMAAKSSLATPSPAHSSSSQSVVLVNESSIASFEASLQCLQDGMSLLGTVKGRGDGDELPYLSGVGTAILSLCTRTPGGVLVLFPSYSVLRRFEEAIKNELKVWSAEGSSSESLVLNIKPVSLWFAINKVKKIFSESTSSSISTSDTSDASLEPVDSFATMLQDFKNTILLDSNEGTFVRGRRRRVDISEGIDEENIVEKKPKLDDSFSGLPPLSSFSYVPDSPLSKPIFDESKALTKGLESHKRGAIMFAVCRGKVSEGLDFADSLCRLVICIGIPFPPLKDPQIEQKRKFLNNKSQKASQAGLEPSITGTQWYEQAAYRAINQGIGRAIRHKNDWGSVAFLDERFCDKSTTRMLPRWLQPTLETSSKSLAAAIYTQGLFFEHIENHPPGNISPSVTWTCSCSCNQCVTNCKR